MVAACSGALGVSLMAQGGCVVGSKECEVGATECMGATTIRECNGGEGYSHWGASVCALRNSAASPPRPDIVATAGSKAQRAGAIRDARESCAGREERAGGQPLRERRCANRDRGSGFQTTAPKFLSRCRSSHRLRLPKRSGDPRAVQDWIRLPPKDSCTSTLRSPSFSKSGWMIASSDFRKASNSPKSIANRFTRPGGPSHARWQRSTDRRRFRSSVQRRRPSSVTRSFSTRRP